MRNLPKISVIIPSLNKVKYIGETLESIVNQNYPNLEVIIQDGGSKDGTEEIIRKYAEKYKYFKWESKKDKGQTDAINKGFKRAKGSILAYINADDLYEPGALKTVGEYFAEKPDTLWIAGKGRVINDRGSEIARFVTAYKNFLLKLNRHNLLLIVNYLMQPSVFLSKRAYQRFGPFKGTGRFVMEYGLWLKMAEKQMPAIIPLKLSSFRIPEKSISKNFYTDTLLGDYKISREFTKNVAIRTLHKLHNIGRILLVRYVE